MKRGIYIASKVVHAPRWRALRAEGVPIISSWIDEAGEGETKSLADLWRRVIEEASSCAALIVYAEAGEAMKGALVEVGAALGGGADVFIAGIEHTVGRWPFHPRCVSCAHLDEAIQGARFVEALARLSGAGGFPEVATGTRPAAAPPVGTVVAEELNHVLVETGERDAYGYPLRRWVAR